ncbi:MAG: hypothetical protein K2N63_08095 [Lachnospiraceae bacterium]|nr:hypothetical protein [Lachnospiraceae bacterium]
MKCGELRNRTSLLERILNNALQEALGKPGISGNAEYIIYVAEKLIEVFILFLGRYHIGNLFGASKEVLVETGNVLPMFLVGIVFLSFTRVTTSGFYATEKSLYSYILVYAEPVLLFMLLLVLPHFTGMTGVWWSTCLSQVFCAFAALLLKSKSDKLDA